MNKDKKKDELEFERGHRKHLERLQEEREANQLIEDYKKLPPEQPEIELEQ